MSPKTRILDDGPYWTRGQPLSRRFQSMRAMGEALRDADLEAHTPTTTRIDRPALEGSVLRLG